MNLLKIRETKHFRKLRPNERYLLFVIYTLPEMRLTISQLSIQADLHRENVAKYVRNLAEYDYLDLILIGNTLEIIKK